MSISTVEYNPSLMQFQYNSFSFNDVQYNQELEPEEEKKVEELKKIDSEVRRHEQAHKSATGKYAPGSPNFEFVAGPDGKRYAVGGEVEIDKSEVPNDPEATIKKAQTIKRAALAPTDPSAKDREVAAEASRLEAKARQELAEQKKVEVNSYSQSGEKVYHSPQPAIVDVVI